MKKFFVATLFVFYSFLLFSQEFIVSGDFRFRPEFRDGYKSLPDSNSTPAAFVAQRVRLSMNYSTEKFSTGLTLHEDNIWGDKQLSSNSVNIGFLNAWAAIHLSKQNKITLGRQELNFDNGRLFSRSNWSQNGKSHDLIRFDHNGSIHNYTFAFAWNQAGDNYSGIDYNSSLPQIKDNYLSMALGRYEVDLNKSKIAAIAVADAFQAPDSSAVYVRATYGLVYSVKLNKWGLKAYAYGQSGQTRFSQTIQSWYLNAETFFSTNSFSAFAGADIVSGNKENSSKFSQFIPLYGSGHSFNGYADYFTNYYNSTAGCGLMDFYLNFKFNLCSRSSLGLNFHNFHTQQNYVEPSKSFDKFLANELDLLFSYNLFPECKLSAGYSCVFAGETLKYLQNSNSHLGNWVFVMLELKPVFFNKK